MKQSDALLIAKELAPVYRRFVDEAVAPLVARVIAVERLLQSLPASVVGGGIDRNNCLFFTLGNGSALEMGNVVGKDGRDGLDGRDGKDADLAAVATMIKEHVSEALAGLTAPVDGKDGAPGRDGRDGLPGAPGAMGEKGLDGKDGRDGVDGKDGKDGRDGVDGLGVDSFDVIQGDDLRTFTMRWANGIKEEKRTFQFPTLMYRGVFQEDQIYACGDTVTWGGSLWHCNEATKGEKPDNKMTGGKSWTLIAKRGADGRDGKPGPQGPKGDKGDPRK